MKKWQLIGLLGAVLLLLAVFIAAVAGVASIATVHCPGVTTTDELARCVGREIGQAVGVLFFISFVAFVRAGLELQQTPGFSTSAAEVILIAWLYKAAFILVILAGGLLILSFLEREKR